MAILALLQSHLTYPTKPLALYSPMSRRPTPPSTRYLPHPPASSQSLEPSARLWGRHARSRTAGKPVGEPEIRCFIRVQAEKREDGVGLGVLLPFEAMEEDTSERGQFVSFSASGRAFCQ